MDFPQKSKIAKLEPEIGLVQQFELNTDFYCCELPDSPVSISEPPSTNENVEDDFGYGALIDRADQRVSQHVHQSRHNDGLTDQSYLAKNVGGSIHKIRGKNLIIMVRGGNFHQVHRSPFSFVAALCMNLIFDAPCFGARHLMHSVFSLLVVHSILHNSYLMHTQTQVVFTQSVCLKKGISHDPQHLSC